MAAPEIAIVANGTDYAPEIAAVTRAAFAKRYGSGDAEAMLIADLRAAGCVVIELAALEQGQVVGHVLFSSLTVEPATMNVATLAPVSVRMDRQRRGICSALIREGLSRCKAMGFDAVTVLGDPGYYGRFGFTREAARAFDSVYDGPAFQACGLRDVLGGSKRVKLIYPDAFARV